MNRFDLENQIQACWSTKDDIDLVIESIASGAMSTDKIADALMGIAQLHEMRCERAFETFTQLIHSGAIADSGSDDYEDIYGGRHGR